MPTHKVLAPLPGIFYRRPSPNEVPFVEEGAQVVPGGAVGLIVVMKNFFPVEDETGGTLVRFLVEDGAAVEAGETIAEIERADGDKKAVHR